MKRKLQLIALTFVATFLFTNLSFAQFVLQKTNGSAAPTEKEDEGQWIHYDTGESTNAIGLNGGGLFEVAARWEPAELAAFEGYGITKMRMYINNVPTSLTARIWQGADAASLDVMLSQFFEGAEESWVEIELQDPYMIDTSLELWIGYQVDDPGAGNFAAGIDGEGDFVGFGNKVRLGTGDWTNLSEFGIAGNWNVQAFVVEMDDPEPGDEFTVTFNVDMSAVEGFDPDVHDVYIAGSLGEGQTWNEPGSNPDLKMTLVGPAKNNPPYTFYENWQEYADFTTVITPWTFHHINDNVTWGASDFDFPGEGTSFAFMVFNPSQTTPAIDGNHPPVDGDKFLVAVQSQTVNDNKWLVTPEVSFDETSNFSFMAKSITDAYGLERIRVHVSTTGNAVADFTQISPGDFMEVPTEWTEYSYDLGGFHGETGYIAIQYVSEDAFFLFLDALWLDAEVAPVEEYIYTITLDLEEGEVQYKYFSTVIDEGWDGGEWVGDPNRVIQVNADMTVNDVFGEQPVSVVENELAEQGVNLFPNPVRNTLYVENSDLINDLRIFDLTGRLIMSQVVNDNNTSINVSEFKTGVYIMQVMTVNGVVSKKFSVQ
jgi:hypothetical protein